MDSGKSGGERLGGWTVLVIADVCAAYWLWRAGVISTTLAVILGAAAFAVILTVRGIVKSREKRRLRERREMLGQLAADVHAVAARRQALSGPAPARTSPRVNLDLEHDRDHGTA